MNNAILKPSHDTHYLEQGYYFALAFNEGWFIGRVINRSWSNLEPWSLGAVASLGNLTAYDEVQDTSSRHYLEPQKEEIIYHTFWGVTPATARIKWQHESRKDLGSMLAINRTLQDNVGFIDGYESPYFGPFSPATEIFTIKDRYPAFQVLNPTGDNMPNVMLHFDQRQYTYSIVTDKALVKDLLVGNRRVKKYTLGNADPQPMTIPQWLQNRIGDDMLKYTRDVMLGVDKPVAGVR